MPNTNPLNHRRRSSSTAKQKQPAATTNKEIGRGTRRRRSSESTARGKGKRSPGSIDEPSSDSDKNKDNKEHKTSDKQLQTTQTQAADSLGRLEDELWYHGLIAREDLPRLLKNHGDFLVRYTELEDKTKSYVLSVMCTTTIRHLVIEKGIKNGENLFFLHKGHKFASIYLLITHYQTPAAQQHPIDGDAVLIKAVNRDQWELTHTQLVLDKKLGEGAFGIVYGGKLRPRGGGQMIPVAIKEAHREVPMDKATKEELMHEARIMFQNQHTNIVRIYGVAATQPPICIVMELILGGTLKDFVIPRPYIHKSELTRFCQHASSGLRFLHDQNVVHRDVAARNCLVKLATGTERHHTVKLADFGLAKGITGEEKLKKNTKMPIKWLAPETVNDKTFAKPSDVWSFGVLVWEVFSRGDDPYPSQHTLNQVIKLLKSGGHMSVEDCEQVPPLIRPLLFRCWAKNASERPTMETVKRELKLIFYNLLDSEKAAAAHQPPTKAKPSRR